ncbi:hypothetical protein ACXR0O_15665 [Verrucomicrobiota bacterium sgz303538]
MSADAKTFSESWYRIADRRVALRPHVEVRRQIYRGERYHVLRDPFTNAFFRLRPAAYDFVARLRQDRTVDAVWRECLEANPEEAPGQEQALRLLSQLHASNLLYSNLPPDSAKVFERSEKRRQREARATLANIMFARFPVFDPDHLLKRLLPVLRVTFSPVGALVWLGVVGAALKVLVDHAGELAVQSQAILAPGNLPLLYIALIGLKVFHEFGHASACRRLGGEVHTVGVMLMIFTPVPYVDTTSSWAFRSRWERAFVGAAGMVVEVFIAALAAFAWSNTSAGALHSIAYNVIFVASVSTLLFNINPLLRFDGYYILSDLLEIPNLQQRSMQQVKYLAERRLFGVKLTHSPATTPGEAFWLAAYGLASQAYRVLLSVSILLFLANRFLILGLILMAVGLLSWGVMPVLKLVHYLAAAPQLARNRGRAVAVCVGGVGVTLAMLGLIPAPNHFRAPGVLQATEETLISTQTAGRAQRIMAQPGERVTRGQPLFQLQNPELELEIRAAQAQLEEAKALRERALEEATADLEPIDSRIAAVEKHLSRLRQDVEALTVRSPHDGIWAAPELGEIREAWLPRGAELGRVVNPDTFYFSAVISQDEASRLFAGEIRSAAVRLWGQSGYELPVREQKVIPAEQERLPSAALGWLAGGEVAVSMREANGVHAQEPFFEVRAIVQPRVPVELLHGRSGKIRFDLPAEPLLPQWARKLHQLLQRRGLT